MKTYLRLAFVICLLLLFSLAFTMPLNATPALQGQSNANATPTPLPTSYFTDRPYSFSQIVTVKGTDIDPSLTPKDCGGSYMTHNPTFRLTWPGDTALLRVFFAESKDSASSPGNPTLIIQPPTGKPVCSNETYNSDPALDFYHPEAGQYDIWVGIFSNGGTVQPQTVSGSLIITELSIITPGLFQDATPNYVSVFFDDNFIDPYDHTIIGGGWNYVSNMQLGDKCEGYITSAPDVVMNWSGSERFLRIFFEAPDSNHHPTLIILDPGGHWQCGDNEGGTSPTIDFATTVKGRYAIWVGSKESNQTVIGSLVITKKNTTP